MLLWVKIILCLWHTVGSFKFSHHWTRLVLNVISLISKQHFANWISIFEVFFRATRKLYFFQRLKKNPDYFVTKLHILYQKTITQPFLIQNISFCYTNSTGFFSNLWKNYNFLVALKDTWHMLIQLAKCCFEINETTFNTNEVAWRFNWCSSAISLRIAKTCIEIGLQQRPWEKRQQIIYYLNNNLFCNL